MKKITAILLLSFISFTASANVTCYGKIDNVLDWKSTSGNKCSITGPDGFVEHHLAYQLDTASNHWICSQSDSSDALVMLAYANQKDVTSRILSASTSCTSLSHYDKHQYLILK